MRIAGLLYLGAALLMGCGAPKLDWPVYGEKLGMKVHFPGPPVDLQDSDSREKRLVCVLIRESAGSAWTPLTKENGSKPATNLDNICFLEASVEEVQDHPGNPISLQVRRSYDVDAGSPKPVKDKLGREWQELHWFWRDAMAKNPRSTLMERDRYMIDGNKVYRLNVKGALGPAETNYFYDSFEIVKST